MKKTTENNLLEKLGEHSNQDLKQMGYNELTELSNQYLNNFKSIINYKKNEIAQSNTKDGVVLLGYTGAGKTTIINYLSGLNGKIKKHGLNEAIIDFTNVKDALPVSNVGSYSSCTFFPQIKIGDSKLFLDCPGSKDNRGFFVNVCNGLTVKNMVSNLNTVKLCLVTEYEALQLAKGKWFLKSIRENILDIVREGYENNVSLIVNKVPQNTELSEVKDLIGNICCEDDKQVQSFIKNIITKEKVAIFSSPDIGENNKNIDTIYWNETQVQKLEELIDNTECFQVDENLKSWPVDQEVLASIFNAYKNTLQVDIEFLTKEYLKQSYELNSNIGRNMLIKDVEGKLDDIKKLNIKDGKISTIDKQLSIFGNSNQIVNLNLLESFLKNNDYQINIQRKICSDLNSASEALGKIYTYISNINIVPVDKQENKEKIFFGNFIDANEIFDSNYNDVSSIKLYATNYITLKNSITLKGINLTIVTPNLMIEDSVKIDLSGENGTNHELSKALNNDGLPGNPGKSSGNFLAIYNQVTNLNLVKIALYGGKGGKGQDGDNGKNGKNGTNAKDFLIQNIDYNHNDHENNINTNLLNYDFNIKEKLFDVQFVNQYPQSITHNIENQIKNCCCIPQYIIQKHTFLIKAMPGQQGGDGFKGGQKGHDGFNGKLTIINKGIQDLKNIVLKNNASISKNGKHGTPGKGGVNGENYALEYFIPEHYYNRDCSAVDFLTCGISKLSIHLLTRNMENSRTQKELKPENTELGVRYANGNQNQPNGKSPNQSDFNSSGIKISKKNNIIDKDITLQEYKEFLNSELLQLHSYYKNQLLEPFIEESVNITGNYIDYSDYI